MRAAPAPVPGVVDKAPCTRRSGHVPWGASHLPQAPAGPDHPQTFTGSWAPCQGSCFPQTLLFWGESGRGRVAPSEVQTGGAAHAPGPHRPSLGPVLPAGLHHGVWQGAGLPPPGTAEVGTPGLVSGLLSVAQHLSECSCLVVMQKRHELRLWLDLGFPVLGPESFLPWAESRLAHHATRGPASDPLVIPTAHYWMPPSPSPGRRNGPAGPGTGPPWGG